MHSLHESKAFLGSHHPLLIDKFNLLMCKFSVLLDWFFFRKVLAFDAMPHDLILDRLKVFNAALAVLGKIVQKLLILLLRLDLVKARW